jgi:The  BURPS668_1122 family of deaminases
LLKNVFEPKKVNSENVIDGEGSWLRNTDSEFKGLNRLANELGAEKGKVYHDVRGNIKVVSERNYCSSCQDVLKQFNEMFPKVDITLIDGLR